MMEIEPAPDGRGRRIGIAVASFNAEITGLLLTGCRQALLENNVLAADIAVVRVPGAWELPMVCQQLAVTGRFDAVIALGAVVRGQTAHFEFISAECARGLQQVGLETGVPVLFGVLTPENAQQARERADPTRYNKGAEVALAALQMIDLQARIESAGVADG